MVKLQRAPSRAYRTPIMDRTHWDNFEVRGDDIVIATYPKCGTTWTQRIVDLLVHGDTGARPIMDMSVWLDSRIFASHDENLATLAAQKHRRFLKSHLPLDALPIYEGVKYIHVARDGRDAFLSWHNHVSGFTPEIQAKVGGIVANDPELIAAMMAGGAGPPGGPPPADPHVFFQGWIAAAEAPPSNGIGRDASYFDLENTYWSQRHRPNLLMVHYADMKANLPEEMARIADFLEIKVAPAKLLELAAAAQFEAMKKQGPDLLPHIANHFDKGSDRFLNKGVNGRWKDVLTPEDLARYDAVVKAKLSPALAAWLEHGRKGAGDPRKSAD